MGSSELTSLHGRRGVIAVTVLAVAALVLGLAAVRLFTPGHESQPATSAQLADAAPRANENLLDVGPTESRAAVTACLSPDFASSADQVTVLYNMVQKTMGDGTTPVLILRNQKGEIRLCDENGGDYPSQLPVGKASAAHPVVFFSAGRRDWSCVQDSHIMSTFTMTQWLAVTDNVDRVQLRFRVDGTDGDWFTTRAHNGFVHMQAWLEGERPAGTKIEIEQRVLDTSGNPVTQSTLPPTQTLSGCAAGGSVQIG
jgi:hypothetical protein